MRPSFGSPRRTSQALRRRGKIDATAQQLIRAALTLTFTATDLMPVATTCF